MVEATTNKSTVLIVEDNPANMKLVGDLLRYNSLNVVEATDGPSALDALKTVRPDLILMDINLPRMSGIDLFKKIREQRRFNSVTIVALTALAMKEDKETILNAGFDGYISKPIDTREFVRLVREKLPAR
ncbi:MAG: response regulator [Candidatus Krumholzibacteriia bacterium]